MEDLQFRYKPKRNRSTELAERNKLNALVQKVSELEGRIAKLEEKKKPGRPPKDVNDAES